MESENRAEKNDRELIFEWAGDAYASPWYGPMPVDRLVPQLELLYSICNPDDLSFWRYAGELVIVAGPFSPPRGWSALMAFQNYSPPTLCAGYYQVQAPPQEKWLVLMSEVGDIGEICTGGKWRYTPKAAA
jgi:hypothetical protein